MKLCRADLEPPVGQRRLRGGLLLGLVSYLTMPREQDPEINFNWVSITTALPGRVPRKSSGW
jgi:hypothetical protein